MGEDLFTQICMGKNGVAKEDAFEAAPWIATHGLRGVLRQGGPGQDSGELKRGLIGTITECVT
eukprot:3829031-Lingulodinium_polyedra.AAC.1